MDQSKKQRLRRYQQDIVDDLDVNHVLDELVTKCAISIEDLDYILKLTSRTEKTRFLLDKVLSGSNDAYQAFVDCLYKDYNWLWEKLAVDNDSDMAINDSFEDSLSKGDVPRLPSHHVRRTAVEQKLADVLRNMKRHNIVAVHGMLGCGSTCVVLSALRHNPDLIIKSFNNVVLWLNFSNCKTDDDYIAMQSKLLRKASSIYVQNPFMNNSISMSSIGSNGDSQSSSTCEWTLSDLKDRLKSQFAEQPLNECLLVLDEVCDRKCLNAFDIGCKILVTTRDTEVLANYSPQIIEIQNCFEEKESLQIFASFLDVDVSKLPRQANKLHEICKGIPFLIRLIGAQLGENKERLLDDPKHWNYYVKKFEKKESLFSWPRPQTNNQMKTIEVCINTLSENIRPLYKRLKILPDNVKVSPKVLRKLWNKDLAEVEAIMTQLRRKSLIIQTYDREQKDYLYEVHDLIMNYLRNTGDDDSKKIHTEFLNSYNYNNTSAPVEIVDDGYIAFYLGYHIKNTDNVNDSWGLFNKLFLDLKFLGNKVRLTGSADVMADLQKYEKFICTDKLDSDLLLSIRSFLSTHGADLHYYPCTNIVQSILQNESKGILYSKANHIAQENCNKNELYFDFLHEQNVEEIKHSTIDVKEKLRAVCFLGDFVLVGTNSGVIKFFHIPTNKLRKELRGPGSPITWIGVACSTNPQIVVALFYDGSLKLWYVDDLLYDDGDIIEEESEDVYNSHFAETETISPKLGPYLNCRWTNSEQFLIMHTDKIIVLWNPLPNVSDKIIAMIDKFDRDTEILSCVPCNHDRYVIVATKSNSHRRVEMIELKTKEKVITFEETGPVLDMITVPGSDKIITLKSNEVMEYEVKISLSSVNSNKCRYKRVIASEEVKENMSFLSIAVNKSGTLLFVSTNDSRVVCVDLKTYTRSFDLENRRGNVVSMAVSELMMNDEFEPGSDVLLTGTGCIEDNAKVWYLDASYIAQTAQKSGRVRLTTNFDVSFVNPSTPQTPNSTPTATESAGNTPRRHQSFANHKETKKILKNTLSLDRHTLKPLNLKGICNNNDNVAQPLLAVIDDKNNIQVMRGQKVLTEITEKSDEYITRVKIAPCNQYIIYGLKSGAVKKYTIRTKETVTIMDIYSKVQFLKFVHTNLLIVAGENRCLMAYQLCLDTGVKRKPIRTEKLSSSSSDTSINSKERLFKNGENKSLCKGSSLVECFWIQDLGIITVEDNATIKLWDKNLNVSTILVGRQPDVHISAASFQNNVLVICDRNNKGFQTFELKLNEEGGLELQTIQEYKLNNVIISCDLTADGNILAMGLDSGNVVVWNVRRKIQLSLLKHHKSKVHSCSFSPVPERSNRNSLIQMSPNPALSPPQLPLDDDEDQPPLVLVTMATEIVWWNITYLMKTRAYRIAKRPGYNVLSPIASPMEVRAETPNANSENNTRSNCNMFFGDGFYLPQHCWKVIWKGKCCKQGSKRREILACIKLSGMNAKRLCHDDKFSCFVTVDNPGHIHIMNVMKANT
ncbi:death-associated APAF1-related killer isoform X2 [Anticarsia gemmatalis]|uniref:death-associated APAF1-related killer isoform X2 n=1 Tax=Anticarsia gemmatalis TaxID=129554 RepID=UPI003F75D660